MVGRIERNLVPMIITFEKDKVEFICKHLGESMLEAYRVIDMFTSEVDDD